MANDPQSSIGDPLLARVERLSRRRSEPITQPTPQTGPFPPPADDSRPGPRYVDVGADRVAAPTAPIRSGPQRNVGGPRRKPRNHPARSARLGALIVSCATAGGLTMLFAGLNESGVSGQALVDPTTTRLPTSTPSTVPASSIPAVGQSPVASSTPSSSSPPTTAAQSAGPQVFDGAVVQTRYGPVAVEAKISGGKLTDVAILDYPSGDRKSVRINDSALPQLRSEVLRAQSSAVDTVSGATYTSEGYIQSLQSALDGARAAGATTIG